MPLRHHEFRLLHIISLSIIAITLTYSCGQSDTGKKPVPVTPKSETWRSADSLRAKYDDGDTVIVVDTATNFLGMRLWVKLAVEMGVTTSHAYVHKNALLTIIDSIGQRVLFQDSMDCSRAKLSLQDFNGDEINDIQVFYTHGANANSYYYLYLANGNRKTFTRVISFDDLPNPSIDSNGIITSTGISATAVYNYYAINDTALQKLGREVTLDINEDGDVKLSANYKHALSAYRKMRNLKHQ